MNEPQNRAADAAKTNKTAPLGWVLVGSVVLALFGALSVLGYRWMQADALATLEEFTGQPERDTRAKQLEWRPADVDDEFRGGDGARTPAGSVAHFRLINGARLKLEPSSQIRFQHGSGTGPLEVDVDLGRVDVQSGAGAITIDSEFGPIVLEANSSVRLSRDGSRLGVDVELGSIQLADKRVSAGDRVALELGGIVVDVPLPEAAAPSALPTDVGAAPEHPKLAVGDGVASTDLVVKAGDSFVVHDPSPPTEVGFRVADVCDGPARLSAGGRVTEALGQANLRFDVGSHSYQIRCLDRPSEIAAKGTVRVLEDAGTAKLPTFAPTANVTTDGRRYTVLYQHRLPTVTVSWPTAPQADAYTLNIGGRSIQTNTPRHTFSSLAKGKHLVTFSAATVPPRKSRTTTIEVTYDTQAPAARVSNPPAGFDPGEPVTISGQALSGWEVSVDGRPVDLDGQQNFSVELTTQGSVPITFTHPTRGTHYYLRRPKAAR